MKKTEEQRRSEEIKKLIERRRLQIKSRMQEIKELQEQCPHFGLTEVPGGDTGNWCKADDKYWYDYKCPNCGKSWRVYVD